MEEQGREEIKKEQTIYLHQSHPHFLQINWCML